MLQAVQGNPESAAEYSLTQKERFPDFPSLTHITNLDLIESGDFTHTADITAMANENVNSNTNLFNGLNYLADQVDTKLASMATNSTNVNEALMGEFKHNRRNKANEKLADGESFVYNINLISAILNQPKYFPLIFTNLGLDLFLYLEPSVNIGVWGGAPTGDGYEITNVKYHCHLVDVDKGFYDRMRQSMMASGGVLQFSGTTYRHYLDSHDNSTTTHNVQISTRVKSLNSLFIRPQRQSLNNNHNRFCLSQGESCAMMNYLFRIGSVQYPQSAVQVSTNGGINADGLKNIGECYNELRKCLGVLGNYSHNSWLNKETFKLGPTVVAGDADTMNNVATTTAQSGSVKNFFVASYGFEGFAKTAAESGINVSDRALPCIAEIQRAAVTTDIAGEQIRYDVFAQTDMIIYLTADGQMSTRI